MQETSLYEGGALNSFGEKFDFEGNDITNKIMNSYSTFGMSLDELKDGTAWKHLRIWADKR